MMDWVKTKDKLPAYGSPVLLVIGGVVQHITYMLDGADDTPDWFEPYFFDHDNELKIHWDEVLAWSYLPDWDQ